MQLKLTPADRERLEIIQQCLKHTITNAEAAARLHLKDLGSGLLCRNVVIPASEPESGK